ncbi:cytochrome P450 [Streptomyces sp. NPDC049555]|uniref:cytochrome P450 n=1 Tax=unclassified Streptomyces TaxID=2593676 RepID=UPI003419A9A0
MSADGGLPAFRTQDVDPRDPYARYRPYREQDPVHRAGDTWYLFRHDDVARVLTSRSYGRGALPARLPAQYAHLRRVVGNWMVFMDPPQHTRVRALVARSFTPRIVETLRPRIRRLAADLAAELSRQVTADGRADLVETFAAPLPILVISELLGVRAQDRPWFRAQAVDLQQATSSRVARRADGYALADAAARELAAYFRAELAARRAGARPHADDLIAAMLRTEEHLPLGDDALVGTCIHLLTAGHETTTNLLAKGLMALLAHPAQLAALRADPHLLPQAVEELVRYDSPVQIVNRWAVADDEIGGRRIGAGEKVALVVGSANRDAARFTDPDRLDLRRDARRHCGFGMGLHYCVGAPLARAEAEIGLEELLRIGPGLAVAPGPEAVVYAHDLVFHGPERLVVHQA